MYLETRLMVIIFSEQVMEYHLQAIDELSLPDEDSDSVYSGEGDTASQRKGRVICLAYGESTKG